MIVEVVCDDCVDLCGWYCWQCLCEVDIGYCWYDCVDCCCIVELGVQFCGYLCGECGVVDWC